MSEVTTSAKQAVRFYLFGSTRSFAHPLPPNIKVCKKAEADEVVRAATKKSVFISLKQSSTIRLFEIGLTTHRTKTSQLLTIDPPPLTSVPSLMGVFGNVLGFGRETRWLPIGELVKVLASDDAANRLIGGAVDVESRTISLIRGSRETLVVPYSSFETSGDGTAPDFSKLGFTDHGRTVVLGDYEASADAILYEEDAAYRQKLKRERAESEKSFGASLRRLRLQRKLTQEDFKPLAKKTISRIEQNEVGKPQGSTLDVIAQKLGVKANDIESY